MNEDIEKFNAQNDRLNNPSEGNFSKAALSGIKTNEEDNRASMAQGIINDLGNQRMDIDAIKQAITLLGTQINQITQALNKGVQPQAQGTEAAKAVNLEAISTLGDVAEKLVTAYKNLKGNDPAPSFIDPNYINEQVKASVMGNFEIGNALISNLKSKLINKAVTASVTEALKDTHEPK